MAYACPSTRCPWLSPTCLPLRPNSPSKTSWKATPSTNPPWPVHAEPTCSSCVPVLPARVTFAAHTPYRLVIIEQNSPKTQMSLIPRVCLTVSTLIQTSIPQYSPSSVTCQGGSLPGVRSVICSLWEELWLPCAVIQNETGFQQRGDGQAPGCQRSATAWHAVAVLQSRLCRRGNRRERPQVTSAAVLRDQELLLGEGEFSIFLSEQHGAHLAVAVPA